MTRRYVAETKICVRGDILQKVTVYPAEINKKQLDKQIGGLTAKVGMLVKGPGGWSYEDL